MLLLHSICPVSDVLRTLCVDWLVYAAVLCLLGLPATVLFWFKLYLKERATTNEIDRELTQTATKKLLSNKSHATANISLLAR